MMLVAERDGLIDEPADITLIVHPRPKPPPSQRASEGGKRAKQYHLCSQISARTEDRHDSPRAPECGGAVNGQPDGWFIQRLLK